MHRCSLLFLLLCYNVYCISENCVTYNFEDNQKVNFTNSYGICHEMCSWDVGEYSSLPIDSPHRDSSIFITPRTTLSCISSFKFSVTASGLFELNVYMEPAVKTDQITLLVFQSLPDANDATVGNAVLSPNDPNFVPGWQTMRVNIVGRGTHEGYITLLGMASESSTVLVDSFRYIAPNYDEDSCIIYPDEELTTEIPAEITTVPVTIEKSTITAQPSTITIPTIPATSTTEKPSTVATPEIPVTSTTAITEKTKITLPTIPETSTTEIPTTIPGKPSTITIPTKPEISTTERPSTIITIPTLGSTSITERTVTNVYETTTRVTSPGSTTVTTSPSTERPRLFVSILLIKIKKFFR